MSLKSRKYDVFFSVALSLVIILSGFAVGRILFLDNNENVDSNRARVPAVVLGSNPSADCKHNWALTVMTKDTGHLILVCGKAERGDIISVEEP